MKKILLPKDLKLLHWELKPSEIGAVFITSPFAWSMENALQENTRTQQLKAACLIPARLLTESLVSASSSSLCSRKSCYYHFRNSDTGRWRKLFLFFLPVLSGCISPFAQAEGWGFFRSIINKSKKKKSAGEDYLGKHFWGWSLTECVRWNGWWEQAVPLPQLHYSHLSEAVQLANPSLPSCSGVEQRHADSCIWQERGLALQKELCKQRHLLLQGSPSLLQLPGGSGTRTRLHKEQPHCELAMHGLLHSNAFFAVHLKVQAR